MAPWCPGGSAPSQGQQRVALAAPAGLNAPLQKKENGRKSPRETQGPLVSHAFTLTLLFPRWEA
jgi:hypothetical protein